MFRILLTISILLSSLNASFTKKEIEEFIPKTMHIIKNDPNSTIWEVFTKDNKFHSYLFETYDQAPVSGFSGGKFNLLVQMDNRGNFIKVSLLEQSEPVFVSGLGVFPLLEFLAQYKGKSLRNNIRVSKKRVGASVQIDGISKATVSAKIANDTILASSIRVAKKKLKGSKPKAISHPRKDLFEKYTWKELLDKKLIKHLRVTKKQAEDLFLHTEYIKKLNADESKEIFLDLYIADLGVPTLYKNLIKQSTQDEIDGQLLVTQEPILILANGSHDILGDDFIANTNPDNLEIKQDGFSLNIKDGDYDINLLDTIPYFEQAIILEVDKRFDFDPSKKWILNTKILRVNNGLYSTPIVRNISMEIKLPEKYFLIKKVKAPVLVKSKPSIKKVSLATKEEEKIVPPLETTALTKNSENEKKLSEKEAVDEVEVPDWLNSVTIEEKEETPFWLDSINEQKPKLIILSLFLSFLFIILYKYQSLLTNLRYKRTILLTFTLFFIGWYGQGQLSIVTLLAVSKALLNSQTLMFLLYDPFSLIIWFFVLLSLLIWGRGTFCGWLCPYGVLQEFSHYLARSLKLPRVIVSEKLNSRLVNVKYFILLCLILSAIFLPDINKFLVEIEPFKTSITLLFDREWPYIIYAVFWLILGMFIFKGFCRYFCPLGAFLSLLGRIRILDWLPRRKECGNPCNNCYKSCKYQAIDENDGHIKYSDCFQCLDCVQIYSDNNLCKVLKKDPVKEKNIYIKKWRQNNE